jgi:hypothetical protein
MKQRLGLVFVILALVLGGCRTGKVGGKDETIQILFIGNSYTFSNAMPELFADLAEQGGHEVEVAAQAKAGYSLIDHARDPGTQKILQDREWDLIILQEKSDLPVLNADLMAAGAQQLTELAQAQGADTILFMPWAYQDGFPAAGLPDYQVMQSRVADSYLGLAKDLGISAAPVGIAWQSVLEHDPQAELWSLDGSHPSWLGSFLAANTIYALIFEENPTGMWKSEASDEIGIEVIQAVQDISADTVLGELNHWRP